MIFAMYPFLYWPRSHKEKLFLFLLFIFIVSTFYPVRQGVTRENGKRLKCCEILSLRICVACSGVNFAVIA